MSACTFIVPFCKVGSLSNNCYFVINIAWPTCTYCKGSKGMSIIMIAFDTYKQEGWVPHFSISLIHCIILLGFVQG